MTQSSLFWDTLGTGDGPSGGYTEATWQDIWRKLLAGGADTVVNVMRDIGSELIVSGTVSPLAVASGAALVYGTLYFNSASEPLAVTTPGATTGGHVILRVDWTAQTVRLIVVQNTSGVSAIPALVQVPGTTYEVRLATYQITSGGAITLTDARTMAHFSTMVNADMLDTSIAGQGLSGGNGTALNVNVDGQTIGITTDTLHVLDAGIDTAQIAPGAVDPTVVGFGMPVMTERQGGDGTQWSAPGANNYTTGFVDIQAGEMSITIGIGNEGATDTITFPHAFAANPLLFATAQLGATAITSKTPTCAINPVGGSDTTQAYVHVNRPEGEAAIATHTVTVDWLAIGTKV